MTTNAQGRKAPSSEPEPIITSADGSQRIESVQSSLFDGIPEKRGKSKKMKPVQLGLFTARELAETGSGQMSWVGDFTGNKLVLQSEDPRTDVEREADERKATQDRMGELFE